MTATSQAKLEVEGGECPAAPRHLKDVSFTVRGSCGEKDEKRAHTTTREGGWSVMQNVEHVHVVHAMHMHREWRARAGSLPTTAAATHTFDRD